MIIGRSKSTTAMHRVHCVTRVKKKKIGNGKHVFILGVFSFPMTTLRKVDLFSDYRGEGGIRLEIFKTGGKFFKPYMTRISNSSHIFLPQIPPA